MLDDPAARRYVASIPYHGYDWKHFGDGLNFWLAFAPRRAENVATGRKLIDVSFGVNNP